jgi:hypothetical protein
LVRNVFLAFVEEDLGLVNLFRGQTKNPNNPLEFHDYSVKVPFDSYNAEYIRREITSLIRMSSVLLCLLGRSTYSSTWVRWEIRTAKELGKGLAGVRLHSSYSDVMPNELSGYDVVDWDTAAIPQTIERAARIAGY